MAANNVSPYEDDEPSHVSQTPENTCPEASNQSLFSMDYNDLAVSLKSFISNYENQKHECKRLEEELASKNREIAGMREEMRDMRFRLQRTHDSLEHGMRFAAWIATIKPDFMDHAATCHGCAKSEYESEVKAYFCRNSTCQPLNLCAECLCKHGSCVKCKQLMTDEKGWKKRRLPQSWGM